MKLRDIKPQERGVSDKCSWNLYMYLKKHGMNQHILWDNSNDRPLHPMNIYVLTDTIGATMQSIMAGRKERYCFFNVSTEYLQEHH